MQKLSVNIGATCPNRDGTLGYGGCIYCNNESFVPSYCHSTDSLINQLTKGKKFFGDKYPHLHYIAYLQAYTSTYLPNKDLCTIYKDILSIDKIEAIIISTRPDCVDEALLKSLSAIVENTHKRIMFEIGVETTHDITLKAINRHHTSSDSSEAITKCAKYGFDVGIHLIMGLPGESEDMMLTTIENVCHLPITSIKLHQLQIIKDTPLHKVWIDNKNIVKLFTIESYLDFCIKALKYIPKDIAIERFTASAPANLVIAPKWGLKNYQFTNLLHNKLL